MLDIGSWEFLIVIVIALIVIGPKDLPALVRTVSYWVRRARELAREFQGGLEDMAREAELDKVKDSLTAEIDPDGMVNTIKREIEDEIEDEWPDEVTALDYLDQEPAKPAATEDRAEPDTEATVEAVETVEAAKTAEVAEGGDAPPEAVDEEAVAAKAESSA
ncbi:MAG: Sec-independent protein translocase protein TatB [Defluviicoccus sp.]|nr:Sec-independent protein translocase protein TatB [Defluviicoccus sp.]